MHETNLKELENRLKHLEAAAKRDVNELCRQESNPGKIIAELMAAAPAYLDLQINKLPVPPKPGIERAVTEFVPLLKNLPESTKSYYLTKVSRQTGLPKKTVTALCRKSQKSDIVGQRTSASSSPALSPSRSREIYIGSKIPTKEVKARICEALNDAGDFFNYGGSLCKATVEHGIEVISSSPLLVHHVTEIASLYVNEDEEGNKIYHSLPDPLARSMVAAQDTARQFKKISLHASQPLLDEAYGNISLGFNVKSGVFRSGSDARVSSGRQYLDQILNPFKWELEDTDKTNMLGMMLTSLVHQHFKGQVPSPIITGNKRGLGKTLLAQVLASVIMGKPAPTLSFLGNDEETEKQLASKVLAGERVLLFDNIKVPRGKREIESSVIERTITDPTVSFRILGRSSDVKVDNNFLVVFTINGGDFSADILDRSIPINLFYDGDVNGVKFPVPDLLNFISTNRMEIFGELLGMWSKWVDAGKPAATVKHRFQRWAETIGGVLETNGHFGFLKSQHSNLGARSAEVRQLIQLITTVEIGRPYTAGQLLTQSIAMGLFEDLARGSERSARNAEFGRLLSSLLGKKFPFRNRQVQLRKGERNSENIPTYIFSFTETALRVAEESQLSLPAEKNNNSCDLAAAGEEEKRNSEVKPDKNASQFWWQK